MKTVLGFAGLLAFALAGAIAPADAQQPKRGGTLKFAVSAETPHYDCHGSETYATLHLLGAVLFDAAALQARRNSPRSKATSRSPGRSRPTC